RDRAHADGPLANASERIRPAQIKAALKNRRNLCRGAVLAKFPRQYSRFRDWDVYTIGAVLTESRRDAGADNGHCRWPIANSAILAASALQSATTTPASVSLLIWPLRRCGSPSVPVTDAKMSGR